MGVVQNPPNLTIYNLLFTLSNFPTDLTSFHTPVSIFDRVPNVKNRILNARVQHVQQAGTQNRNLDLRRHITVHDQKTRVNDRRREYFIPPTTTLKPTFLVVFQTRTPPKDLMKLLERPGI